MARTKRIAKVEGIKAEEQTVQDLNAIALVLGASKEPWAGLKVEVLWSAMCWLKRHPCASIEEAIDMGLGEWDK